MFVSIAPRLRGFFACRKPLRFPGKDIVARIAYDDPLSVTPTGKIPHVRIGKSDDKN
jgi:hypothetical protein